MEGPHFLMSEVAAVAFDVRREQPRILAGVMSWHWGPTVQVSDDGGRTWTEEEQRAIAFDKDDDTALKRVWQLVGRPPRRPGRLAAASPTRSGAATTAARATPSTGLSGTTRTARSGGEGFGGGAIHTVVPDPVTRRSCSSP